MNSRKTKLRVALTGAMLLGLTWLVPGSVDAQSYHSYCGHGSKGIINTHKFLSHLYAAPTLEKHKDGSFIANEVWIGYYYCGH